MTGTGSRSAGQNPHADFFQFCLRQRLAPKRHATTLSRPWVGQLAPQKTALGLPGRHAQQPRSTGRIVGWGYAYELVVREGRLEHEPAGGRSRGMARSQSTPRIEDSGLQLGKCATTGVGEVRPVTGTSTHQNRGCHGRAHPPCQRSNATLVATTSHDGLQALRGTDHDARHALLDEFPAAHLSSLTGKLFHRLVGSGIVVVVHQQVELASVGQQTERYTLLCAHLRAALVRRSSAALGHVTGHVDHFALQRDLFLRPDGASRREGQAPEPDCPREYQCFPLPHKAISMLADPAMSNSVASHPPTLPLDRWKLGADRASTSVPERTHRAEAFALGRADARSRRMQLWFVYGTGLAIGLHIALIHLYLWRSPGAFFFFLGATLVYSTLMLTLWNYVLPRFARQSFASRLALQIVVSIAAFAALSFLTVEANSFLFGGHSILNPYDGPDRTITIPAAALRGAPVIYALMPILPTAVLCVVGFNLHWWRILSLQARERELQELAASAQLAALRAQMNPHFFFNSLNSIAQLIHTDPNKAEACVERLAEIFRYLLNRSDTEFVPLAEEIRVVEAYLEIERARFGEDLRVEWDIDERTKRARVPCFVLQPLVENAVKHGISRKVGGGVLTISAVVENKQLRLTVRDTGNGTAEHETVFDRGVGLRSVRDRLVGLYGERYAPRFHSAPGQGTEVTLEVPWQRNEEHG